MPPETLGGQYLQQYFILGGGESFAYRALWFQGKLKEKVLQSFNLWHFFPLFINTQPDPHGVGCLFFCEAQALWDSMRWHAEMASVILRLPQRGFWHMAVGYIQKPSLKTPTWNNLYCKKRQMRWILHKKKKYGLSYVTWWQSRIEKWVQKARRSI